MTKANKTKEFFREAFKGYEVPSNIRSFSVAVCMAFNIKGISDPMYIANVTAKALGIGDGSGNFNDSRPQLENAGTLAKRLACSYGCNNADVGIIEALVKACMAGTVKQQLLALGMKEEELGNWCSDLHVKVTSVSEKWLETYAYAQQVKRFRSQIDGTLWFDVPFAYTEYYEQRRR